MELTVFARPAVLDRFRTSCTDVAEDLLRRASALEAATGAYLRATELAYEARTRGAVPTVGAYAHALHNLGGWVGRVGDAFDDAALIDGRRFTTFERLVDDLPLAFRLAGGPHAAGALVAANAVAEGAHLRDLRAMAGLFGGVSTVAAQVVDVAEGPAGRSISRYLDWGAAMARGATESEARWRSEADRELPSRVGRAVLDGAIATAGAYGGSAAGIAIGGSACASLGPPVQAVCAASGARAGNAVGGALAEIVSDVILGPEPAPPIMPRDGSAIVEARIEATAAQVTESAIARADFVLERPWLWDDEFADAPHVPAPVVPASVVPSDGPR